MFPGISVRGPAAHGEGVSSFPRGASIRRSGLSDSIRVCWPRARGAPGKLGPRRKLKGLMSRPVLTGNTNQEAAGYWSRRAGGGGWRGEEGA